MPATRTEDRSVMRLHLVDGTYELFRAHFSKRPLRTDPAGRDVKATVGVVESLLGLLHDADEAVDHVAVAFDNPITSFRNELFDGYKDGAEVDPALLAQLDDVEAAVEALGVTIWSMEAFEADDALASAATRWADEVDQVRILTPDKDLGQVVRGDRIVQVDRARARTFDAAGVEARLGVPPAAVADLLALVGDTADGIPGLPGFGAKTASALLGRYGHIEAIPPQPEDWEVAVRGAPRLATTLRERMDDVLLCRRLATLVTDLDLPGGLDQLRFEGVPREHFARWCLAAGADRLADRPRRWAA